MIFMECQWITFDDWLFEDDNETLRLAELLECALWVGQQKLLSNQHLPQTKKDYLTLPLFISSFGQEIIEIYINTLKLNRCGECRDCKLISPPDMLSLQWRGQALLSIHNGRRLNYFSTRNCDLRRRHEHNRL